MSETKNRPRHFRPRASRPYMPDYGVLDAQSGTGLLPWSWATERISQARTYWIATTRPGGSPHMTPVWGVWLNEAFYFSSGQRSRKARNLEANPRCVVCPERTDEVVILEGVSEKVINSNVLKQFADVYSTKYQWKMHPTQDGVRDDYGNEGLVFAVRGRIVFGFGEDLTSSATRWRFDDERVS